MDDEQPLLVTDEARGLPLGMLSVSDRVTNDVFKEDLKDTTGLLVDETRDTLHTSTTSETADSRLGDTCMAKLGNEAMG